MIQPSWLLVAVVVNCVTIFGSPLKSRYDRYLVNSAVQRFREYLQIDTSQQENIKYAVDFLAQQAQELGLSLNVYTQRGGMPVAVLTVEGSKPSLPSIMLNSHMDVVPADENEWEHPPFAAFMDKNGDIYARGAQDTKDVGIQYIEAIRKLKHNNVTLLRTLHVTYMPDEETGGFGGMKTFIDTEDFQSLNIGFALDEGMISAEDMLYATYEDRRPWQIQFVVHGEGGHGFTMPEGTAAVKALKLLNIINNYRDVQMKIMKSTTPTDYGAYTSVNVNIIQGGYAPNIIPSKMSLVTDMRLSSNATVSDLEDFVKELLNAAGNGTELSFIRREDVSGRTQLDDSNPYWVTLKKTVNDLGYPIEPIVCPATSDMLALRNRGIQAVGFSTKVRTISRFHSKDEYLNAETFVKGIDIYAEIIKNLGNLPSQQKVNSRYSDKKRNCA